jgi:hypothetical protein
MLRTFSNFIFNSSSSWFSLKMNTVSFKVIKFLDSRKMPKYILYKYIRSFLKNIQINKKNGIFLCVL